MALEILSIIGSSGHKCKEQEDRPEEFCHLKILEKKNEFVRKTRNRMKERILKSF